MLFDACNPPDHPVAFGQHVDFAVVHSSVRIAGLGAWIEAQFAHRVDTIDMFDAHQFAGRPLERCVGRVCVGPFDEVVCGNSSIEHFLCAFGITSPV